MNNEELIRQLQELRDSLPMSEFDQALFARQDEIRELQDKIANNDNYRDGVAPTPVVTSTEVPTADDWAFGAHAENGTEGTVPPVTNNEVQINSENELLRQHFNELRTNIEDAQKEIAEDNIALEDARETLTNRRREFAQANNMSDNFDVNSPEFEGQQALIAMLESQIAELEKNIATNQSWVEDMQSSLNDPRTGADALEAAIAEDPSVNYVRKFEDMRRLDKLNNVYQTEASELANENGYVKGDAVNQINNWIEQLNNGVNPEEITDAIGALATRINTQSSVEEDRETRLAEIDRLIAENSMELAEIQNRFVESRLVKLNYALSSIQGEAYDKKVARIQSARDLATGDAQKAEIERLEREFLTASAERRAEIAQLTAQKRSEYAAARNSRDDAAIDRFDAKMAELRDEQSRVLTNEQLNRINELRTELTTTNDIVRSEQIWDEIEGILGNIIVDDNKLRLDQKREAELLSAKAALETEKDFLSVGIVEKLTTIQQGIIDGNYAAKSNPEGSELDALFNGAQPVDPGKIADQNGSELDALFNGAQIVDPNNTNANNGVQPSGEPLRDIDLLMSPDKTITVKKADGTQPSMDNQTPGLGKMFEPIKPLTDAERKKNLQAALEKDTMRNDWLERAENEGVYWQQPGQDGEPKVEKDAKPAGKLKIKVAGFAAAGAALLNKAKGMLDKAKAKLADSKTVEHFKKHWKKYVIAAAGLLLISCSTDKVTDLQIGEPDAQEQEADDIIPEVVTPDETTPEEVTPEEAEPEAEAENDKDDTKDDNKPSNADTNQQNNNQQPAPAPENQGLNLQSDVDLTQPQPTGEIDNTGNIIGQSTEEISSTPGTLQGEYINTSGGEVLNQTTETISDVTQNPDGVTDNINNETGLSDDANIGDNNSIDTGDTTPGAISHIDYTVIGDDEQKPDIGDGEIVGSEDVQSNDVVVEPDLGGGTIETGDEAQQSNNDQTPVQQTDDDDIMIGLSSGESLTVPEQYSANYSDLAMSVRENGDGTITIENDTDQDQNVQAQERESVAQVTADTETEDMVNALLGEFEDELTQGGMHR